MANECWPGYQSMISFDPPETIVARHESNLAFYDCPLEECVILDLQPCTGYDYRKGLRSVYRMRWTSYRGWKVYMLSTGIYTCIPEFETVS